MTSSVLGLNGADETDDCRALYREAVLAHARHDPDIYCLDTDQGGYEDHFQAALPEQYVDAGIAEANALSVAAGLASTGKTVFVNTMATFASSRALEQLKIDVAYNDLPVKVVGTHCGLSGGHYGPTHHSCEDLAIMRSLANMKVVVPADGAATTWAVEAAIETPGPVYLRLGRGATPRVYKDPPPFALGRAVVLREGWDVTIVAAGPLPVAIALAAARLLALEGHGARVLDVHTIKPLDVEVLVRAATETLGFVSVEDHNVLGGLGTAVAEALSAEAPALVRRVGVPDRFCPYVGRHEELLEHFDITPRRVADTALQVIGASLDGGLRRHRDRTRGGFVEPKGGVDAALS